MLKKTSCKIVHISSISAISLRGSAPYAASKTFLNSYLTTLARELGETNIVVSVLCQEHYLQKVDTGIG